MNRRRLLLAMGAATASGGLAAGSGALSSSRTNRGLNVEVVGDDEAYVRLMYASDVGDPDANGVRSIALCGPAPATLFTIGNHLTTPVDIQVDDLSGVLDIVDTPGTLGVGDAGDVVVSCTGSGTALLRIQAVGSNGELAVDVERVFDVSCLSPSDPTCLPGNGNGPGDGTGDGTLCPGERPVTFTGQGNVRIERYSAQSLPLVVWYLRNGSLTPIQPTVTNTQGTDFLLQPQNVSGVLSSDKFAAVYIPADDVTYYHQNLACEWSIQGGSGSNQPTPLKSCGLEPPISFFGCNST